MKTTFIADFEAYMPAEFNGAPYGLLINEHGTQYRLLNFYGLRRHALEVCYSICR